MTDIANFMAAYTRVLAAALGLGEDFAPIFAQRLRDDAYARYDADHRLAVGLACAATLLQIEPIGPVE